MLHQSCLDVQVNSDACLMSSLPVRVELFSVRVSLLLWLSQLQCGSSINGEFSGKTDRVEASAI